MNSRAHQTVLLTLSLVVAASLHAGVASAQAADSRAQAVAHFKRATELEALGQWQEAERELGEALKLHLTPGLVYHRAFCLEQLGDRVGAHDGYVRARGLLVTAEPTANTAQVQQLLVDAIPRVERQLFQLVVTAADVKAPLQLRAAGQAPRPLSAGTAVWLEPGAYSVVVLGGAAPPRPVSGRAGEHLRIQLAAKETRVAPTRAARPRAAVSTPPAGGPPTWLLLTEGAVAVGGVALLGVGLAQSSGASSDEEAARARIDQVDPSVSACAAPGAAVAADCTTLADAVDGQRGARSLMVAGGVVAGLGAASLVGTWLFWPRSSRGRERAPIARAAPVAAPWLSPSSVGVSAVARF